MSARARLIVAVNQRMGASYKTRWEDWAALDHALDAVIAEEREACAQICDNNDECIEYCGGGEGYAQEIRARGGK